MSETNYLSEARQGLGAAIAAGPGQMGQAEWFFHEATARAAIDAAQTLRAILAELQAQRLEPCVEHVGEAVGELREEVLPTLTVAAAADEPGCFDCYDTGRIIDEDDPSRHGDPCHCAARKED